MAELTKSNLEFQAFTDIYSVFKSSFDMTGTESDWQKLFKNRSECDAKYKGTKVYSLVQGMLGAVTKYYTDLYGEER